MQFQIYSRDGHVLYETDSSSISQCLSKAVREQVNLYEANLSGINLTGINLVGARLIKADLSNTLLADADLSHAFLCEADFKDANLNGTSLIGANLDNTDLSMARIAGANFSYAYISNTKIREGVVVHRPPLHIYGLQWPITIWDGLMQIGCQSHSFAEWASFDDRQIIRMAGSKALKFWNTFKGTLFDIAERDNRCTVKGLFTS